MNKPKVLLFDLGGVIVRWVGLDELAILSGLTRETVIKRFMSSSILTSYETGQCTDDEFIAELRSVFNLSGHNNSLKRQWNDWVKPTYPGVKKAILALRARYRTACLSNTNSLHWKRLEDHISTDVFFEKSYASHHLNLAKPDKRIYQHVLDDMKVAASDVWFFDDTMTNIKAAQNLGIHAHHVERQFGVMPTLARLRLL